MSFWNSFAFSMIHVGNLISVSSVFSKSRLYIWKFSVYCFILIFIFNLPFSSKVSLLRTSQIHLLSKFNLQSTFLRLDFCNTHLTIQPTSILAFFDVFSTSYLEYSLQTIDQIVPPLSSYLKIFYASHRVIRIKV